MSQRVIPIMLIDISFYEIDWDLCGVFGVATVAEGEVGVILSACTYSPLPLLFRINSLLAWSLTSLLRPPVSKLSLSLSQPGRQWFVHPDSISLSFSPLVMLGSHIHTHIHTPAKCARRRIRTDVQTQSSDLPASRRLVPSLTATTVPPPSSTTLRSC